MKTIKTIAIIVALLFGFNFYLNHFYTKFDDRIYNTEQTVESADTTVASQPASDSDSLLFTTDYGLAVYKTGYMYYFEKLLNNSGYDFTWQDTYNTIPHILKGDFIYE